MKYDLEYFIKKFEAIPEDQWTAGVFMDDDGRCCAYGHCGANENSPTLESGMLSDLCPLTISVNDNKAGKYSHFGDTPKERVVNYLKSLRK